MTEREADDLVRDADRFLAVVEQALGLAPHAASPQLCVPPCRAHPRQLTRLAVAMDPFVHLHVASGYSLQYGASHPHVLVERAAEHEMDTLALTDRDGTYGAVKIAKACRAARAPAGARGRPRGPAPVVGTPTRRRQPDAAHPGARRRVPRRPAGCPG